MFVLRFPPESAENVLNVTKPATCFHHCSFLRLLHQLWLGNHTERRRSVVVALFKNKQEISCV